jgi:hypothetical protein
MATRIPRSHVFHALQFESQQVAVKRDGGFEIGDGDTDVVT